MNAKREQEPLVSDVLERLRRGLERFFGRFDPIAHRLCAAPGGGEHALEASIADRAERHRGLCVELDRPIEIARLVAEPAEVAEQMGSEHVRAGALEGREASLVVLARDLEPPELLLEDAEVSFDETDQQRIGVRFVDLERPPVVLSRLVEPAPLEVEAPEIGEELGGARSIAERARERERLLVGAARFFELAAGMMQEPEPPQCSRARVLRERPRERDRSLVVGARLLEPALSLERLPRVGEELRALGVAGRELERFTQEEEAFVGATGPRERAAEGLQERRARIGRRDRERACEQRHAPIAVSASREHAIGREREIDGLAGSRAHPPARGRVLERREHVVALAKEDGLVLERPDEPRVVIGVSIAGSARVFALSEALARVGEDAREEIEADRVSGAHRAHEALLAEALQELDRARAEHRLRRLQIEAPAEDRASGERAPLVLGEELPAPVERASKAHRLPLRQAELALAIELRSSGRLGEEIEPPVQALVELRDAERLEPRGRELERERDAVELVEQASEHRRVLGVDREAAGPSGEQLVRLGPLDPRGIGLRGIGQRQRPQLEHLLVAHSELLPGGDEHADRGRHREPAHDERRHVLDHVLGVVEQHEASARSQRMRDAILRGGVVFERQPERARERRHHVGGRSTRGEIGDHRVLFGGDLEREAGLPDAGRAGDRDQSMPAGEIAKLRDVALAPDQDRASLRDRTLTLLHRRHVVTASTDARRRSARLRSRRHVSASSIFAYASRAMNRFLVSIVFLVACSDEIELPGPIAGGGVAEGPADRLVVHAIADPDGAALAGAEISFGGTVVGTTDGDGVLSIDDPGAPPFSLRVSAAGRRTTEWIGVGATRVTIPLQPIAAPTRRMSIAWDGFTFEAGRSYGAFVGGTVRREDVALDAALPTSDTFVDVVDATPIEVDVSISSSHVYAFLLERDDAGTPADRTDDTFSIAAFGLSSAIETEAVAATVVAVPSSSLVGLTIGVGTLPEDLIAADVIGVPGLNLEDGQIVLIPAAASLSGPQPDAVDGAVAYWAVAEAQEAGMTSRVIARSLASGTLADPTELPSGDFLAPPVGNTLPSGASYWVIDSAGARTVSFDAELVAPPSGATVRAVAGTLDPADFVWRTATDTATAVSSRVEP
jgi:hypothetical protein